MFKAFEKYKLSLTKRSDGTHNLQAESSDSSHHVEFNLTPEQSFELLSKGCSEINGRVNGALNEDKPVAKETLGWNDYLKLILRQYANKPDDYTVTVGDMSGGDVSLPEYRGFMQMRLGDLRGFSTKE